MKRKCWIAILLCALLLTGCTPAPDPAPTTVPPETQPLKEDALLDALLEKMTIRQKIGQLFIVRPDALSPGLSQEQICDPSAEGVTELTAEMTDTLQNYPVGGIAVFGKNIASPEQITAFTQALQNASEVPLFLALDEEGGLVARLANNRAFDLPKYPSASIIGASGDDFEAFVMGGTIGGYIQEYGFNMDFAPVADVNTNPDNTVIGTRAFSSDAETAAKMANAMASGLYQRGVIAVFKHFPGHGDTAEDSHLGLAVSHKTAEEMRECEWLPFLEAGSEDCIMVGHIAAPEITGSMIPSTMSAQMVTGILKGELGFSGLVLTDALEMQAITDTYTSGEAALNALQAGCDLLLMPYDLREAFDAVVAAVEDGTLSEEWLDGTVRRILEFKMLHNIIPN